MRPTLGMTRTAVSVTLALLAVTVVGALSSVVGQSESAVGRFSVLSEVGGAVWAFQPGGRLIVVGPGGLVARGTWTEGPRSGEVDASLRIESSGQDLTILGAISPDGQQVALYVAASDPAVPDGWTPWPSESRLVGQRVTALPDASASPMPDPLDCLRPSWGSDDAVDWDRCNAAEATPTAAALTPPQEASPTAATEPGPDA